MRYQVRFVDDGALPSTVEWAFARTAGETYLFVKHSAIDAATGRCEALTRAWEAWQAQSSSSSCPTVSSALRIRSMSAVW